MGYADPTVGTPVSPADEVRVLGIGTEDEVPDGQRGELACRGPYTIPGYYRAAQHNASSFTTDGFYRTGDLVTRHVVGGRDYYAIDGRIKDVINGARRRSMPRRSRNCSCAIPTSTTPR